MEDSGIGIIGTIVYLGFLIFIIASLWKIFEKAGQPGWAAIVPFYNVYILTQIIGKPWWWTILLIIPYVNIVFGIWAANLLSKSFGKTELFTVGLILLSFVFYPILGFGDAKYVGPAGNGFNALDGANMGTDILDS